MRLYIVGTGSLYFFPLTKRRYHMRWIFTAGAALILVMAVSGCRANVTVRGPKIKHPVVVVKKGHIHTPKCGHYRHGGRWYIHKGHIHRKGCGHVFKGKVWIWKP